MEIRLLRLLVFNLSLTGFHSDVTPILDVCTCGLWAVGYGA